VIRRWLAAAAAGAGFACGGGSTAPTGEVAYDFSFADPAADTVAATANPRAVTAPDLLTVSGTVDRDQVTVRLEFASGVSRWSEAGPGALDGFINFDLDKSSTGTPVGDIGVDAYVDLRDNGAGRVGFVNVGTGQLTLLDGTWDGTAFVIKIPRQLLVHGTDNDNKFYMTVQVGGRDRKPDADVAPNTGHLVVDPPAPAAP